MSRLDVPSTHGLFFETRSEKPRGIIARSDAGSRARMYDALVAWLHLQIRAAHGFETRLYVSSVAE